MSINKGRVAIVTGAAQGIGKGLALRLAGAGAYVAVCDVNEAAAGAVTDEILAAGGIAITVCGDVGSKADAERIAQTAIEKWGKVDILVNNAGIIRDAMFYKMTEEQWDAVIRVNLKGPFLMTQAVYSSMRNQKYGRIINISSSSCRGNVGQANYSSTKAGVIALTNVAALEMARYGITANAICPGTIDTPMARSVPKDVFDGWCQAIPAQRIGTPDDMAEAVLFFASEESGFINGQTIWVDGAMQTGLKAK